MFLAIFLAGCNQPAKESVKILSLDSRWVLEATGTDHGALAPSVTVVNIHPAAEGWKSEDNVLVVPGVHTVNAFWEDNHTVRIDCIQCPLGDAETIVSKIGPLQIRYETPSR